MPELVTPLWIVIGFFSSFALFPGLVCLHEYRKLRWLRRVRRRPIGEIGVGNAFVEGTIVPIAGELLHCPLSDGDCVYYRIVASRGVGRGKSKAFLQEQRSVVFGVQDQTGTIRVNLQSLRPVAATRSGHSLNAEQEQQLYQRFGFLSGVSRHRYAESLLQPGDRVFVSGTVEMDRPTGVLQFRGNNLLVSNLGQRWHEQRHKHGMLTSGCMSAFFVVLTVAAAYSLLSAC